MYLKKRLPNVNDELFYLIVDIVGIIRLFLKKMNSKGGNLSQKLKILLVPYEKNKNKHLDVEI